MVLARADILITTCPPLRPPDGHFNSTALSYHALYNYIQSSACAFLYVLRTFKECRNDSGSCTVGSSENKSASESDALLIRCLDALLIRWSDGLLIRLSKLRCFADQIVRSLTSSFLDQQQMLIYALDSVNSNLKGLFLNSAI